MDPEVYRLCEEFGVEYEIRLRMNQVLDRLFALMIGRDGGIVFDSPHSLHYVARKGRGLYLVQQTLG